MSKEIYMCCKKKVEKEKNYKDRVGKGRSKKVTSLETLSALVVIAIVVGRGDCR